MSLWYVRRKPCTSLVSRLALSPNSLKLASSWASSPRSTIRCDENDLWAYDMFGANRAPILHRHNTISKRTEMSFHLSLINYEYYGARSKWFLSLWYVRCKPCAYLALRLPLSPDGPIVTLSPKGSKWGSTWHTYPKRYISCTNTNIVSKWTEMSFHLSLVK
jgi:hypothetical protein